MSFNVPHSQLVEQRIRNRIFEWLEMLVAWKMDPPTWGLNEALNQWEDWNTSPAVIESYPQPIYTSDEADCLVLVAAAWLSFCEVTPDKIIHEDVEVLRPEWLRLVGAATRAIEVLKRRGMLPEYMEVDRANHAEHGRPMTPLPR